MTLKQLELEREPRYCRFADVDIQNNVTLPEAAERIWGGIAKILVLNSPNLNMLGIRGSEIYGKTTYANLLVMTRNRAANIGDEVTFSQSDNEGLPVDIIYVACENMDGIIINLATYTHTSVALLDAVNAFELPITEVHISKPNQWDEF